MPAFASASSPATPSRPRLLRVRRMLFAVLLACVGGVAAAEETLTQALDDFDQHGYASPLVAMQRLRAVTDRPGPNAAIDTQLRYHSRLALLAVHGKYKQELDTEIGEIKRLTESGRCKPCAPTLLTLRVVQAELSNDRATLRPLADQLTALPPSNDLHFEAERFAILSRARTLLNEEEQALRLGIQAVDLAGRSGLPALEARLMNVLARAHLMRGDLASALRVVNDCYEMAKRIGFRFLMAQAAINRSYTYGTLKQPAKEHEALLDVLRVTQGVPGTESLEQIALSNLGAYHIHRGQYAESIRYSLAAEKIARDKGDESGWSFAVSNRGSALARSGRVDEGLALMKQGIEKAETLGDRREVVDLLSEQVNVLEVVGRDREALAALRRVVELSGAITSAEREKAMLELQEKFSAERKTREIERLSLSNAAAQAEVAARAWQQRLWAALAVVLLLSAALLAQWLRMVRRRNQALVVDNAALTSQSIHDPLTGAFNRRHFEQLMAQQEATVQGRSPDRNYQAAVGLVLLDVDHFKRVNDTYGHAAGDAVLKEVAERLRSLVRDQDAVVRWGGEEFVLVLPGTGHEGLPVVAAKALNAIGRAPVVHDGVAIHVRASAGTVAWPSWPTQSWADALHLADLALYLSKTSGRNRASCVMGLREGADLGRVYGDLAGAAEAGEVTLQVVPGPVLPE